MEMQSNRNVNRIKMRTPSSPPTIPSLRNNYDFISDERRDHTDTIPADGDRLQIAQIPTVLTGSMATNIDLSKIESARKLNNISPPPRKE